MKRVLITGGSGFVGRHLIGQILQRFSDVGVTSLSRSEGGISQLLIECQDKRLRILMADVRDLEAVKYAARGVDTLVHLAAMKRVDLSEMQCREAVGINVTGTMNMLEVFKGDTFVLMSTDKAVEPVNCYGASKLVAEKLVLEQAFKCEPGRRFMIIRSGNILGSTGSVIDIWKHQIESANEITVTHPEMLRFYTSVEGVGRLYLAVLERGENGKIYFTPRGEALLLKQLVEKAIKLYGDKDTKVKFIGLRPGERMREKMRMADEINTVSDFAEIVEAKAAAPKVS